ncbi:unnamed protein product [Umbelopsis ramanniana]
MPQFAAQRRSIFTNFPIPFEHPYTVPVLIAALSTSSLIYYYLSASHDAELRNAQRRRDLQKRKSMKRPEDRFASMKHNGHYVNPFEEWQDVTVYETIVHWIARLKGNGIPYDRKKLEEALPVKTPDLELIKAAKAKDVGRHMTESWVDVEKESSSGSQNKTTITWFGQSTCIVTLDGLTILTDPVFSARSVNDYVGPKRLRTVPGSIKDYKGIIDIVLVSHDHFDHLDEQVVRELNNTVTWYIPLGLRDWFVRRGVLNVIELDWWQEIHHKERPNVVIAAVPAMHWSGSRIPFDKNTSLWSSFVVKSPNGSFFFCGDTGYSDELFSVIGKMYAPFSLAAFPIGSYEPRRLMKHVHMGPDEAVQAHNDLGRPTLSVGIHWGTFMMSDEHYLDPPKKLREAWLESEAQRQPVDANRKSQFITTAFGETVLVEN